MSPVLLSSSIPAAVGPNLQLPSSPVPSVAASTSSRSVSLFFARDKAIADAVLLEAQQKVASLAAIAAYFQVAPLLQTSGPALKAPLPLLCLSLLWFNPPTWVQDSKKGYFCC